MPGSSPEIANAFIGLAKDQGRSLDQMQLQELVYIAHGWCLAMTGDPLTGDRPKAKPYGHEYEKLATALAAYGAAPLMQPIPGANCDLDAAQAPAYGQFSKMERSLIASIFSQYGNLLTGQMAILTRGPQSAWEKVYADGTGLDRVIPDGEIRAQFLALADTFPPENMAP